MISRIVVMLVISSMTCVAATDSVSYKKAQVLFEKKGKKKTKLRQRNIDFSFDNGHIVVREKNESTVVEKIHRDDVRRLTYEYSKSPRVALIISPVLLLSGLFKSKEHWFSVEYGTDDAPKYLTLRLHKSNYKQVLDAAKLELGKDVEKIEGTGGIANPTARSKDVKEVIPYSPQEIVEALKIAMEAHNCNVKKVKPDYVECKRPRGDRGAAGAGGEKVSAKLKAEDGGTRIKIETGKGFAGRLLKRNWSTPIYTEMMKVLNQGT